MSTRYHPAWDLIAVITVPFRWVLLRFISLNRFFPLRFAVNRG